MTDQEMQKIIEGLKNDPEVGAQVRELLAAKQFTTQPQNIDPQLSRQAKQLMALYGGGTFGEQVGAHVRNGCAQAIFALMVIGAILGAIGIILLIAVAVVR